MTEEEFRTAKREREREKERTSEWDGREGDASEKGRKHGDGVVTGNDGVQVGLSRLDLLCGEGGREGRNKLWPLSERRKRRRRRRGRWRGSGGERARRESQRIMLLLHSSLLPPSPSLDQVLNLTFSLSSSDVK